VFSAIFLFPKQVESGNGKAVENPLGLAVVRDIYGGEWRKRALKKQSHLRMAAFELMVQRLLLAERGLSICLRSRGLLVACVRSAGRRGRGVMHLRHSPKFPRWDHFWDQRVHFGEL